MQEGSQGQAKQTVADIVRDPALGITSGMQEGSQGHAKQTVADIVRDPAPASRQGCKRVARSKTRSAAPGIAQKREPRPEGTPGPDALVNRERSRAPSGRRP